MITFSLFYENSLNVQDFTLHQIILGLNKKKIKTKPYQLSTSAINLFTLFGIKNGRLNKLRK